jgi:hypothetical protein
MKKLSKDEMKKTIGGIDPPNPGYCSATCIGSVGSWTYTNPANGLTCLMDIHTYCRSDYGVCTECH